MARAELSDARHATGGNDAERALLARVASGDRVAFQELYFAYHRRLSRFLLRLSQRHDVVEEIVNDTMWIVWRSAAEFRGQSAVSTWILGIAYRRALKTLRSKRAKEWFIDLVAQLPSTSVDSRDSDDQRDWLTHALSELPIDQRAALELCYVQGHSCEEIAAIMNCPTNTVKSRMFQARQKLQSILARLAVPNRS
jgi:RNA polymerase sigma-70 factor, ECF subfamily